MTDIHFRNADGINSDAVSLAKPLPVAPSSGASGLVPVTGSFAATGTSASFTPIAGRGFNVSLWGAFSGSVQLERSFDSGTTWLQAAAARTAPDTFVCLDAESGVQYRLNCTVYSSGPINYRVSQ